MNDLSSGQYSANINIAFKTLILSSDLSDYSDAYFVVKGRITFEGENDDKTGNKMLIVKNNAPFRLYIWKIDNIFYATVLFVTM